MTPMNIYWQQNTKGIHSNKKFNIKKITDYHENYYIKYF